jgi:hypothetical protein
MLYRLQRQAKGASDEFLISIRLPANSLPNILQI